MGEVAGRGESDDPYDWGDCGWCDKPLSEPNPDCSHPAGHPRAQGRGLSDPRDPHPCGTCGVTLVYDGWDSVHVEGPQKGYGEDNCRWVADHPGGVITPEERASLDAYEGTGL